MGKKDRAEDTAEGDGDENEAPCSDMQPPDGLHGPFFRNISAT
jgi:hypothetical protein